jgi:hypothetical protein
MARRGYPAEFRRRVVDLVEGVRVFCPGGARPPTEVMVSFIEEHREELWVEPICQQLPIAPSSYYEQKAREADPSRLPKRAIRLTDDPPKDLIGRELGQLPIYVYGSRSYLREANTLDPAECQWVFWQEDNNKLDQEKTLKKSWPDANVILRTNRHRRCA